MESLTVVSQENQLNPMTETSSNFTITNQTISYANSAKQVLANLDLGIGLIRDEASSQPLKIMPLGDQLTAGRDDLWSSFTTGYRLELWRKFTTLGLKVDFVGSQRSSLQPPRIYDWEHEGHYGWEIENGVVGSIRDSIDGWINTYQPDFILSMLGTNDTVNHSGVVVTNRLSNLIDTITSNPSFQGELFVASIPPKQAPQTQQSIQNGEDYNELIPQLIQSKIAEGKNVKFVDMRSLLTVQDLESPDPEFSGLEVYPDYGGNQKIANEWFNNVLDAVGETNSLSGIQNIIGSPLSDVLSGDWRNNYLEAGDGNDQIIGNDGNDTLQGGNQNDSLDGGNGSDILMGGAGIDWLDGGIDNGSFLITEKSDLLDGGEGDDSLIGGAGQDTLMGGAGNDTYKIKDNYAEIIETVDSGIDLVYSNINYTLPDHVEKLELVKWDNLKPLPTEGRGNNSNNRIAGNEIDNLLVGYAGHDELYGAGGNDTLEGGDGDDTLDGGNLGSVIQGDSLIGGTGNDVYYLYTPNDVIVEDPDAGIDLVYSRVSYTLPETVENLYLVGYDEGSILRHINGIGNSQNNRILGNIGDNVLAGMGGDDNLDSGRGDDTLDGGEGNDKLNGNLGHDKMSGGAGDDLYYVHEVEDIVTENVAAGIDSIFSIVSYALPTEVEHLFLVGTEAVNATGNEKPNTLSGNSAHNLLLGHAGIDSVNGNGGDDTLNGGAGDDFLTGSSGHDCFLYDTQRAFVTTDIGVDRIRDFLSGSDQIILSQQTFSTIASELGNGFSVPTEFATVTSDTAASTSAAKIVYNSANGKLFYNENQDAAGFGIGGVFAMLSNVPTVVANDFQII